MRETFSQHSLEFTRVAAINGSDISEAERFALNPNRTLSMGELATILSHRKCWQTIVDEALPCGAIFEDDVILSSGASKILRDLEAVAAELDIVRFELWPKLSAPLLKDSISLGGAQLRRLGGTYLGTAGYLISLNAARKLLAKTKTLKTPIDHFLFDPMALDFCQLKSWQLTSPICVQMMFVADSPACGSSLVEAERVCFRAETGKKVARLNWARKKIYKQKNRIMHFFGILEHVNLCWPDADLKIVTKHS
jgi:glycosyl transferase family 25